MQEQVKELMKELQQSELKLYELESDVMTLNEVMASEKKQKRIVKSLGEVGKPTKALGRLLH